MLNREAFLDSLDQLKKPEPYFRSESDSNRGGVLTARSQPPWQRYSAENLPPRLMISLNLNDAFPLFSGCPEWIKPLLYQEYQV